MAAALKIEKQSYVHDHKHHDDHNCTSCHHHHKDEEKTSTISLLKKIHENNGHQCIDPGCEIEAPHGHNHVHEHKHHEHKDHDHHHNHDFPIFPLEDFISHTKIAKPLKEFFLNASFLSPAMLSSSLLENLPLPQIIKTWISITFMHGLNRGKQKLPRLGLTYLISGAANIGSKTALGSKASRFLATSAVAFVEKFSNNGHHHEKETLKQMFKRETGTLTKNLTNKKQWQELLPSLINIETKVQILAPIMNKLAVRFSNKLDSSNNMFSKLIAKIFFTSASFAGMDKLLTHFAKKYIGEDSAFAASLSSVCGCCGSPVCSAAATDTALSNSM